MHNGFVVTDNMRNIKTYNRKKRIRSSLSNYQGGSAVCQTIYIKELIT